MYSSFEHHFLFFFIYSYFFLLLVCTNALVTELLKATYSLTHSLIAEISTELPCLRDLENPNQLSVREVLMILSYVFFFILILFMFLGSRNPLLIFLQSYHVWVT